MIKDTVESEVSDEDKRGKLPLDGHVCEKELIEGKTKPKKTTLESPLAGTGFEAPEQPCLLLKEMQRMTVGTYTAADGSLELREIISLPSCNQRETR